MFIRERALVRRRRGCRSCFRALTRNSLVIHEVARPVRRPVVAELKTNRRCVDVTPEEVLLRRGGVAGRVRCPDRKRGELEPPTARRIQFAARLRR